MRYSTMTATFDGRDSEYRYTLVREWVGGNGKTCAFICLNPSTADASRDDPTVRRCVGYSVRWGFSRFVMLNLFAFRATDPDHMRIQSDPVGPENDRHIHDEAARAGLVVCAWGAHGAHLGRAESVVAGLRRAGVDLHYLRMTNRGEPGHPLYLPRTLAPQQWLVEVAA